jgi:hypothetical protein
MIDYGLKKNIAFKVDAIKNCEFNRKSWDFLYQNIKRSNFA